MVIYTGSLILASDISAFNDKLGSVIEDTTPQLGGDLDVNDFNIGFESVVSSNVSVNGLIVSDVVAEDVAFGDVLYYSNSDSAWMKSDANAGSTMPGLRMSAATITSGNSGDLLMRGIARDDTWTLAPGSLLFPGATAGVFSETAPSTTGDQVQCVGIALGSVFMEFNPSLVLVEIA